MQDYNTLLMFASSSILLALAPGPDNLFVLTQSMLFGRSAGFKITLGLCTGLIFLPGEGKVYLEYIKNETL